MIVTSLEKIAGTERDVSGPDWRSRRFTLAGDGLGYTLTDTVMAAGTETYMQYVNHVEAVYCIAGEAEIINEETKEVHHIGPGTLYILDRHDPHTFRAITEVRNVCIFTPALTGGEVHDENGAYPAAEEMA
ncbi:ectoine synthase [Streptomyces sp. AC602_WCS936]|uniref:ectoine synthase n=1 Tax=Streptomyces sp. AC602_WCS936 TaxID=2823685 RepID=UPI001C2727D8|nr:ectoine synthase [Streptomyces sp. AC602_WCS936]